MPPAPLVQSERLRGLLVTLAMLAILAFALAMAGLASKRGQRTTEFTLGGFSFQVPATWEQHPFHNRHGIEAHLLQDPMRSQRHLVIAHLAPSVAPSIDAALDAACDSFALGDLYDIRWNNRAGDELESELPARWRIGYAPRHETAYTVAVVRDAAGNSLAIALSSLADPQLHQNDIELVRAIARTIRTAKPPSSNSQRQLVHRPGNSPTLAAVTMEPSGLR